MHTMHVCIYNTYFCVQLHRGVDMEIVFDAARGYLFVKSICSWQLHCKTQGIKSTPLGCLLCLKYFIDWINAWRSVDTEIVFDTARGYLLRKMNFSVNIARTSVVQLVFSRFVVFSWFFMLFVLGESLSMNTLGVVFNTVVVCLKKLQYRSLYGTSCTALTRLGVRRS